jgi:hypothetical protein
VFRSTIAHQVAHYVTSRGRLWYNAWRSLRLLGLEIAAMVLVSLKNFVFSPGSTFKHPYSALDPEAVNTHSDSSFALQSAPDRQSPVDVCNDKRRTDPVERSRSSAFWSCLSDPRIVSDATIGLSDGLTVPFALTAGLSALGSSRIVIFGGMAELISGAISMGLGGWLAASGEAYVQSHQAC